MLKDFILPDIGEGIVECELVEWLVNEGDSVAEDQAVAEVMTDKALVQIPSMYSGTVAKLYHAKGDIAKVHQPLFQIEIDGESTGNNESTSERATESTPETESDASAATEENSTNAEVTVANNSDSDSDSEQPASSAPSVRAVASPAVRRIAREMNIELSNINGSGKKGRVLKSDLVNYSQSSSSTENLPSSWVEPIKGVKAAMAKQMQLSVSTIPHITCTDEVEMSALIDARNQLKVALASKRLKLTFMPFFMKALSLALREFPILNSQPNDECTELTYFNYHNIGVAVDSKIGLLVPNIKNVQSKSIEQLSIELANITEKAREGRLSPNQLSGGTISISNIGAIGGLYATPIINKPEVAIVALGKIQQLPRFDESGKVIKANIMPISWSADHRVLDGATLVRFSNRWKQYLENPLAMFAELK